MNCGEPFSHSLSVSFFFIALKLKTKFFLYSAFPFLSAVLTDVGQRTVSLIVVKKNRKYKINVNMEKRRK